MKPPTIVILRVKKALCWKRKLVLSKRVASDHTSVEDHTSKNIWAAQIDLDGFKGKKKGHKVRLVGKQGEMDLERVGGGELNMIKTHMNLKRIKKIKSKFCSCDSIGNCKESLVVLHLL